MIYYSAVSFILGIILEKFFSFGWSVALFVAFVSIIVFLVLYPEKNKNNFAKNFFIIGLFLSLGILRMSFVDTLPDQNLYKLVGQKISFEAEIVDEPDVRDASARYTVKANQNSFSEYPQKCTDIFLLKNSSCSPQSGSQGISENTCSKNFDSLVILIANRFPEYRYGNKIKVSGKLDLPKNFQTSGGEFDYVSYLAKDKIHFLIYNPQIDPVSSGATELRGTRKIVSALYSLKNIFIKKISAVVPEPNSSLLAGMIFGSKQSLGEDLLNDFKTAGLIHIVVLSGYNITIIAAGIFSLVSRSGKRNFSFLVSLISIILFSLMVGLGATVARAAIMASIAILARFLGRPSDALRWLFIAGFLMLIWNPLYLLKDPSFQLSFMATLGLIIFTPAVQEKIYDPFVRLLAKIKAPVSITSFFSDKFGLREIISSTLAVQFFILPLLIKMSGQFSIISFLVNPIVLPFVPWVMAFGGLTGGLGVIPFVGKILSWPFGAISYFMTQIIILITEFSSGISSAVFSIGALSSSSIFVWYSAYAILYFKFLKQKKNLQNFSII